MTKEEFLQLAKKISSGSATEAEIGLYNSWFNTHNIREEWDEHALGLRDQKAVAIFKNIQTGITSREHLNVKRMWYRIAAAASLIAGLFVGGYYLLHKQQGQDIVIIKIHDIAPGNNKAILTLANGEKIILSDAQNGKIAQQGNTAINKTQDGKIVYQVSGKSTSAEATCNTTTTPRGGQYHIVLADGSDVWLNAASSITYPTKFAKNDRTVSVTGEAYFEVTHDAARPFRVKCQGQTVEVLGTHFNINAYTDENTVKTTLLEGRVRINTGGQQGLLLPGEQSQVAVMTSGEGLLREVQHVDTDATVAWKNGHFQFEKADIKTVLRQFSRWYDVKIVYEGDIDDRVFSGAIYRNLSAAKALELLSFANVHFIIDGKKIIVSNH